MTCVVNGQYYNTKLGISYVHTNFITNFLKVRLKIIYCIRETYSFLHYELFLLFYELFMSNNPSKKRKMSCVPILFFSNPTPFSSFFVLRNCEPCRPYEHFS